MLMVAGCSTKKELSYLNNLDLEETGGESFFTMDIPDYKVQPRDILYVSAKTQTPDGMLEEILARIDNPKFAGEVTYMKSNFVQGIKAMPITFEKRL